AAFGVAAIAVYYLGEFVPRLLGLPANIPYPVSDDGINARSFLQLLMSQLGAALAFTFVFAFVLLFLSMLLRRKWLGIGAGWLLLCGVAVLTVSWKSPVSWPFTAVIITLFVVAVVRYGMLVGLTALFFYHLIVFFPITTELSAWYATSFIFDLVVLVALAVFGFYTSLGGQPLIRGKLLED
ncbi:MAG TPA: hypothetical protein VJT09_14150, partial [Pyrinomonadaceae bacterium]|nr:hypothetical protein [Pyrinomonadaceae bacterium]